MTWKQHLQNTFHLNSFRPGQEEIIRSIMDKNDTLAILPTGNGKSLCYQFPATLLPGLTIVVSPLISLMQDQFRQLSEHNIPAGTWNSTLSATRIKQLKQKLQKGEIKLLYLSPEKLSSPELRPLLPTLNVNLLVVDEAHCISQWGHDFRPEYTRLGEIVRLFPVRPTVAAFTATATPVVAQEIVASLGLVNPRTHTQTPYRPNLRLVILHPPSEAQKRNTLLQLLNYWQEELWGSAIVYAATRQEAELLAGLIRRFGFKQALPYHAGLDQRTRTRSLRRFLTSPRSLLVATSALGMGIDKPNVRLVIHHTTPTSLEAYTQEAGRAGRDGLEAWCVLLHRDEDLVRNYQFTTEKAIPNRRAHLQKLARKMYRFVHSRECAARLIVRSFTLDGKADRLLSCGCSRCRPEFPWQPADPVVPETASELLGLLTRLRKEKAKLLSIPPYFLGTNQTLQRLAEAKPKTWTELKHIGGIGHARLFYWGKDILQLTKNYGLET